MKLLQRVTAAVRQPTRPAPFATPLTDADRATPGTFVIGCQRSGTSLLRRILDSHPDLACGPESKFLLPLLSLLDSGSSMRGLASMGYDEEEVRRRIGSFASAFFRDYAASRGKARWADKTPNHVDVVDKLAAVFGEGTRFVLLERDGRDVAYSLSQRHYPAMDPYLEVADGDVPVAAALFWRDRMARMRDFASRNAGAALWITYEDLVTEPDAALRPLFDFLDLPWDPRVIEFARWRHDEGFEDPDIRWTRSIEPRIGHHRRWPADVIERVTLACGPMLDVTRAGAVSASQGTRAAS